MPKDVGPIGSGTPEVVGSIPGRGEFPPPVKKNPSPVTRRRAPVYGWGRGSGVFLPAMKKSFYLSNNAVGAVLPPQIKFFKISNGFHVSFGFYNLPKIFFKDMIIGLSFENN